jgi:hypothetical protein
VLLGRLLAAGVTDITVRMDKGFFSRVMVQALYALDVSFPPQGSRPQVGAASPGSRRRSEKDPSIWTATGTLYDARLLSCDWRRPLAAEEGSLGHRANLWR